MTPFRFSPGPSRRWVKLGRFVGVLGALAVVAAKLVRWAKSPRERVRPLALDVSDLTEVASIPPPAPPPRHHPRVPSLSRPDVHAFEATSAAPAPQPLENGALHPH